jgi:O-antigen biosynthesis protein
MQQYFGLGISPDMRLNVLLLTSRHQECQPPHGECLRYIVLADPTIDEFRASVAKHNPVLVLSSGPKETWRPLFGVDFGIRKMWCHFDDGIPPEEDALLHLYVENNMAHALEETRPLISVVTTTFHSGPKLLRPYQSLLAQTYDHWEWICVDDSKDEDTYRQLQQLAAQDARIRVLKAPTHSGYIGAVKQMSASLARGVWLVELDHDDILAPSLLQCIVNIHHKYPAAAFIYSDFVELHEQDDSPFKYNDFYAYGFGAYATQFVRGRWQHVAQAPPINPITLSHIVGVPNHVRVWKASVYAAIGKHHQSLPVADDYDLILRTFLHTDFSSAQWVRIAAPMYFQYRNEHGNNFTLLRNHLIQQLVPPIHGLYAAALARKYEELGWPAPGAFPDGPCWKTQDLPYTAVETTYVPEDQDPRNPCVSIVYAVDGHGQGDVEDAVATVMRQTHQNWILFVVASQCPFLDTCMEQYQDARVRYFNFTTQTATLEHLQTYALDMLVRTKHHCDYHTDGADMRADVQALTRRLTS